MLAPVRGRRDFPQRFRPLAHLGWHARRVIRICVDSNSQLTADLASRFGITVVPLPIRVEGRDHLEGVDLDVDEFYSAWDGGRSPRIVTSQPSPGHLADAYRSMVDDGATAILSVHIGSELSGTLDSARLAAREVDVPVRLVDTGTASFGISCCAWAAALAIEDGASLEDAAGAAETLARHLGTAFVVGIPELITRSGRATELDIDAAAEEGMPILATIDGDLGVLDTVKTVDEAVESMVGYALAWRPDDRRGLRVAVGTSDRSSRPVAEGLTAALGDDPRVESLVEYRVGPSVGAHLGPGTAGLFVF
jgi:DegV family protein with EDD domain